MATEPQASLLVELRARTAPQHARLDAGFATAGAFTRERYVALLRASLAVVEPIERAMERWLPEVAAANRTRQIRADLEALGETASPAPRAAASIDSLASAVGVAYVVEGSALGGVVLATRFEAALGLVPDAATRYLKLHGRGTGPRWAAFLAELVDHDAVFDRDARDSACTAACATFEAYARAFTQHGLLFP